MTEQFYIGQIIEGEYPEGLVAWCNAQGNVAITPIGKTEDGTRRFELRVRTRATRPIKEQWFNANFFEIPDYGWYRKRPKGYADAVTSFNTAYNMVQALGSLPAGSLIFYTKPDFTNKEQATEGWLLANQIKSEEMDKETFNRFFSVAVQTWNTQEHK